jgi:hypothetical protein
MAKKKIHPSLLPSVTDDEAAAYGGNPLHGEEYPSEESYGRAVDDDEDDGDDDEEELLAPDDATARQFAELNRQLGELKADNEHLRRSIPPAQPHNPQVQEEEVAIDWDELLFKDPKAALKLHGDMVAKQVKRELTADYQRDQGEQRFWSDFYARNEDLKNDHALVVSTMNANFNTIGNMRSDLAAEKLADLTRAEILRYSKRTVDGPAKKSRAFAEGAAPAKPRTPRAPETNVTSLSDVIRQRRIKKFNRGRVA